MAQVVYSAHALADLERAFAFLADEAPEAETASVEAIRTAVEMLERHPWVGRPVRAGLRELVISYGRTGYVALYRVVPSRGQIRVLAIRHQQQLDYLG